VSDTEHLEITNNKLSKHRELIRNWKSMSERIDHEAIIEDEDLSY
jgi:hypothetical protein